VLNARHYAAKLKVNKHKYALKWYRQNHFEPLKLHSKGAKSTQKSGVFVAKSEKLGLKK